MPSPRLVTTGMTTEQNEQWQKAVMRTYPAPASDGQEGTVEQWRNHQIAGVALGRQAGRKPIPLQQVHCGAGSFVREPQERQIQSLSPLVVTVGYG